jgi:mRNA-degrading endonuclease toxin of MazEF toxin-antitoxin module
MATTRSGWYPKRGEVYIVQLDKPRPAMVLSVDQINKHALDVCVVGITTVERKSFSMRVLIKKGEANLNFDCWAKCDQVTSLEKTFLRYPAIGVLPAATFARIEEQVRICLGLV